MEKHNALGTWKMGVNEFSDLTQVGLSLSLLGRIFTFTFGFHFWVSLSLLGLIFTFTHPGRNFESYKYI